VILRGLRCSPRSPQSVRSREAAPSCSYVTSGVHRPIGYPGIYHIHGRPGHFETTVGYNARPEYPFSIRINVACGCSPQQPNGQHNCANGQAVPALRWSGNRELHSQESLCLPAGAVLAGRRRTSMTVDSQGTIYVESIRGVPGGLDLWRWDRAFGPNAEEDRMLTEPCVQVRGSADCGIFVALFAVQAGLRRGGGDGDVAVNVPDQVKQHSNWLWSVCPQRNYRQPLH